VVVDFWAEQSGPCCSIAPALEIAAEMGVSPSPAQCGRNPDIMTRYGVRSSDADSVQERRADRDAGRRHAEAAPVGLDRPVDLIRLSRAFPKGRERFATLLRFAQS
jgi:hypothetical protein